MFLSPKRRLQALLDVVDDMLVGAPEPAPAPHPHDRTVRLRVTRRGGTVTSRPMHCLCPVRPPSTGRGRGAERDGAIRGS